MRLWLSSMNHVRELDSVLDEEDGDVVAGCSISNVNIVNSVFRDSPNNVPVTLLGVKLHSKASYVADGVSASP